MERAGGLPVGDAGVDYGVQLQRSAYAAEVRALYAAAHLSLDGDLAALARAPRFAPDAAAMQRLSRATPEFPTPDMPPVLSMHDVADGVVAVENEAAFRDGITTAGQGALLRQAYVHAAGHCIFTPAETVSALLALIHRVDSGSWPDTSGDALGASAAAIGSEIRSYRLRPPVLRAPAFVEWQPATDFVRPGCACTAPEPL